MGMCAREGGATRGRLRVHVADSRQDTCERVKLSCAVYVMVLSLLLSSAERCCILVSSWSYRIWPKLRRRSARKMQVLFELRVSLRHTWTANTFLQKYIKTTYESFPNSTCCRRLSGFGLDLCI